MKKKVLCIIGSIVLAIVVILILMFTGILPNIFVDRSDLVCSRVYIETESFVHKNFVVIKFDNKGIIKGGTEEDEIIYNDEELALKAYEQLQNSITNENEVNVKMENKTITTNKDLEISLDQMKMKKKQIKKVYEEFGYECE